MRAFLLFWALPISFIASWYGLSANDFHLGTTLFSRETHDLVFSLYGQILGVAPEALPPMLLKALIVDTLVVLAFVAFRRRKAIAAYLRRRGEAQASRRSRPDSLSSAP